MASGISFEPLPASPADKYPGAQSTDRAPAGFAEHLGQDNAFPGQASQSTSSTVKDRPRPAEPTAAAEGPSSLDQTVGRQDQTAPSSETAPTSEHEKVEETIEAGEETSAPQSAGSTPVTLTPAAQPVVSPDTTALAPGAERDVAADQLPTENGVAAANNASVESQPPSRTNSLRRKALVGETGASKEPLADEIQPAELTSQIHEETHVAEAPHTIDGNASVVERPDVVAPNRELASAGTLVTNEAREAAQPGEPFQGTNDAAPEAQSEGVRLASADRVRLVQRVARAVEAARPDGEIRLRLRPPELGSVDLRVKMEEGNLAARIETETPAARSLLVEHLPELRERLAEMQIRIERFDVEWRGGGFNGNGSSSGQHGDSRDAQRSPLAASPRQPHSPSGASSTPPPTARPHRGELNVLI